MGVEVPVLPNSQSRPEKQKKHFMGLDATMWVSFPGFQGGDSRIYVQLRHIARGERVVGGGGGLGGCLFYLGGGVPKAPPSLLVLEMNPWHPCENYMGLVD